MFFATQITRHRQQSGMFANDGVIAKRTGFETLVLRLYPAKLNGLQPTCTEISSNG